MKLYKYNPKSLQFEQIKLKSYIWLFLGICLLFSSFGFTGAINFNNFLEKVPVIIRSNEQQFNEENLRKEIKRLNLRFGDIIVAQYKLETGNGTSQVFKENNNLFGMKQARLRPSTALGENLNHAYYNNWQECVQDYAFWQVYMAKDIRNEDEYYQLLDEIYAEGDNYSQKLKQLQ